jgi:cell division protein FtsB
MPLRKPNRRQLALAVTVATAVAVVGGLAWGFGQQLALARLMQTEEGRLEQLVAAEQARHDELVARLKYIESDEHVEHWARGEAKMARPGEVVVVVSTDAGGEPADDAQPTPTPEAEAQPFWVELWELIFARSGQ